MSSTAPATPNVETRRVMRQMRARTLLINPDGGYRIHNGRDKGRVATKLVDATIAAGWAHKTDDDHVVLTDAGRAALALADGGGNLTTSITNKGTP